MLFTGENTLNVLFIGMPGSGKSSTINILLGKKKCKSGLTLNTKGITLEMDAYELEFELESGKEISKDLFQFTHKANWTQYHCVIFCFAMQN